MLAEDPVQLALVVLLLGHVVVLACRRRPCRERVIVELEVICFAAYQNREGGNETAGEAQGVSGMVHAEAA